MRRELRAAAFLAEATHMTRPVGGDGKQAFDGPSDEEFALMTPEDHEREMASHIKKYEESPRNTSAAAYHASMAMHHERAAYEKRHASPPE